MRGFSSRLKSFLKLFKFRRSSTKNARTSPIAPNVNAQSMTRRDTKAITCPSTGNAQVDIRSPQSPSLEENKKDGAGALSKVIGSKTTDQDVERNMTVSDNTYNTPGYTLHEDDITMTSEDPFPQEALDRVVALASCLLACRATSDSETAVQGHNRRSRNISSSRLADLLFCDTISAMGLTQERYNGNIIFESLCPEFAPDIVVTPAEDDDTLPEIARNNCAGPQHPSSLVVPPFFGLTCRMHTYQEFMSMFYIPIPCPPEPPTPTSLFIESPCPELAPHILINFAPPTSPHVLEMSPGLACTQDTAFLIALTPYEALQLVHSNWAREQALVEESDSSEDLSSYASSIVRPDTPNGLQRVHSGYFSSEQEEADVEDEDITEAYQIYRDYEANAGQENLMDDDAQMKDDTTKTKFFISSQDDWDTESLPDMETDPFFIEDRARRSR